MKKRTIFLLFLAFGAAVFFFYSWISKSSTNHNFFEAIISNVDKTNMTERDLIVMRELLVLAKEIHNAKIHVRGVKSSKAIFKASNRMANILKLYQINMKNILERKPKQHTSVCSEVYLGNSIGYPFFYTGYEPGNCSTAPKLSTVVTFTSVYLGKNISELQSMLLNVKKTGVKTFIGLKELNVDEVEKFFSYSLQNVKFVKAEGSLGNTWNTLIDQVDTKYVFIGRDVTWLNADVRLERLVRQIERTGATTAAGSFRNATGHWFIGCQQRTFRNFSLVYEAGYFESFEACQFCDHADGPFMISTELAKSNKFNEKITKEGLFEDFFWRLEDKEHLVCPDALFFTNILERSFKPEDWQSFVSIHGVHRLKFSGKEVSLPCPAWYPCTPVKNGGLSPCCQKELADLLVTFMNQCDAENILCELDSGSVMGAVKFHSILPWEKDADTIFLSDNYSYIMGLKDKFKKKGYILQAVNDSWKWRPAVNGSARSSKGFFYLRSKHWYIEMWGMSYLGSEDEVRAGQPRTRMNVNGHWVHNIRNPAIYARNRYSGEIFQHAQHWGETGMKSSWEAYKTNQFNPCGKPGHPSCLDQFNADGNLQFQDPIP